MMQTITVTINPETIMFLILALAILLAFYLRWKPEKKKPVAHKKTKSPRELAKIKREVARLERMLKNK